jgi:hypothetical protein
MIMAKKKAVKKRKRVTVKLLPARHAGKVPEAHAIMRELIKKHHQHLSDAKIAIAWRLGWKCDADGRQKLGQVKKGSDLDRAFSKFDFVILLNYEVWNQGGLDKKQKLALVDHELCHCQIANDSNGEPKIDDEGRTCYRIRRHDVEEFIEVTKRHGLHTHELIAFAQKGIADSKRPLLAAAENESKRTTERVKRDRTQGKERKKSVKKM